MGFKDPTQWAAARLIARYLRVSAAAERSPGEVNVDDVMRRWSERGATAVATAAFGRFPS